MKSISAAIVAVGGLLSLVLCGFIGHSDTQAFMGFVSFVVMATGLVTWGWSLRGEFPSTWADRENAARVETSHGR